MKSGFVKGVYALVTAVTIMGSTSISSNAVEIKEDITTGSSISIESVEESKNYYSETDAEESKIDNYYISEVNYKQDMDKIVMPYIKSRLESGYINGVDNAKLYYEVYRSDNSKGSIVISHGCGECLEKYHELTYYFLKNGYNVFGLEHRGHGRSGSLGIVDKTQLHVKKFDDYITDFKTFMDEIVVPDSEGKKLYLYSHSMGGAIAAEFLEEYPGYFDRAVLNSPMLEINTGSFPEAAAWAAVKLAVLFGQGEKYVVGSGPFEPSYTFESQSTSSENRWAYVNDIVNSHEEFQRGGQSNQMSNEVFKVAKKIRTKENASKVEIPVIIFQAGKDTYVKDNGEKKFAEYAKNCTIVRIDEAMHGIYEERDEIQKPYLEKLMDFFEG